MIKDEDGHTAGIHSNATLLTSLITANPTAADFLLNAAASAVLHYRRATGE